MADDAADIVGIDVERSRDGAALNRILTVGKAHEPRQVALAGGDGACHGEVTDGGTVDVAERCRALIVIVCNRGGDGVSVAEEGAAEGFHLRAARHGAHLSGHVDVLGQLHVLAAEAHAIVDIAGERIPSIRAANKVGSSLSAFAL